MKFSRVRILLPEYSRIIKPGMYVIIITHHGRIMEFRKQAKDWSGLSPMLDLNRTSPLKRWCIAGDLI